MIPEKVIKLNGVADQPRRAGKPPAISPEVGASCAGWATIALICSLTMIRISAPV
jgi:hypothetical protein